MVVLDRELKGAWLDSALRISARRLTLGAGRQLLMKELGSASLGDEALKKTVTALTRLWLMPVDRRTNVALWALTHADRTSEWRPLHLGALLAREPFMLTLLEACGREHKARGTIDTVNLRKRMRDQHGPRRSIDIATQRGVQTLRSLGVLVGDPGSSSSVLDGLEITDSELGAWLVHCLLIGRDAESVALDDLRHAPELFGVRLPRVLPRSAAGVSKHTEGVGRVVFAIDGFGRTQ